MRQPVDGLVVLREPSDHVVQRLDTAEHQPGVAWVRRRGCGCGWGWAVVTTQHHHVTRAGCWCRCCWQDNRSGGRSGALRPRGLACRLCCLPADWGGDLSIRRQAGVRPLLARLVGPREPGPGLRHGRRQNPLRETHLRQRRAQSAGHIHSASSPQQGQLMHQR